MKREFIKLMAKGQKAPFPASMVAMCAAALVLLMALAACGGGAQQVSAAKFCTDASATFSTIQSLTSTGLAPPGKSALTSAAAQIRKLVDEAPAQIKADLVTEQTFLEKASINGIDAVDSATTNSETAAEGRLNAYATQNCGSGTVSTGTSPSTSTSASGQATGSLAAFCQDERTAASLVAAIDDTVKLGRTPSSTQIQQAVEATARLAAEAPADLVGRSVQTGAVVPLSAAPGLEADATKLSNDMASLAASGSTSNLDTTPVALDAASLDSDTSSGLTCS